MKSMSQLLTDWKQARAKMEKLHGDLPRIMGNEGVKVVKENFRLSGYDSGSGVKGWEARSAKTNAAYDRNRGKKGKGKKGKGKKSTYKGSVYSSSSPLLRQTNNLYNGVHYEAKSKGVFIGVDKGVIPYAKRMNEGGGGVPARKYITAENEGPNQKVLKRVHKKVLSERDKAMQAFKK